MKEMQKELKKQFNQQISESLNAKGNYKEVLNKNTKDYYNSVREYFEIQIENN